MRVVFAGASRFHFFEAAAQLKQKGMLGRVVTGILPSRIGRTSLSADDFVHVPFWQSLFFVSLSRTDDGPLQRWLEQRALAAVDREAAFQVEGCDALVTMGTTGLRAGRAIQKQGGLHLVDRPVIHQRTQDEVLAEAYGQAGVPYLPMDESKIVNAEAEYAECDGLLVPSDLVAQSLVKRGVDRRKVFVIPLGAELGQFWKEGDQSEGEFVLGFAGNVTIQKGIHVLAEAIEKLKGRRLRVWLAGMVMPEARAFISRLGEACELEVLGKIGVEELRQRMSSSHAFVLPSVQDGFGMVIPQAMSCGAAVIVSRNAGASELITHGQNGLLFESGSGKSLSEMIDLLISQPELRSEMAARGRETVHELGGWSAYGQRLAEVLGAMTEGRSDALSFDSQVQANEPGQQAQRLLVAP